MSQGPVFLIGGGWNEAAFPETYGRFVAATRGATGLRIVCVLHDTDDRDAYFARSVGAFESIGVSTLAPIFVSAQRPLQPADLAGAAGVLIGGGLTPAYYDAVYPTMDRWLPELIRRGAPYAGFSAGAMIAPERGIIGGWKLTRTDSEVVICSEDVSEDEEELDVRPGLGLVPFAVDVHASQYGTLTRLLHAVQAGLVMEGWAIDEDTMVEYISGTVTVHGLGSAYRVRRRGPSLDVEILRHDDRRDVG